ncbi:hypothetical protein BV497_15195 [Fulvimonas soli]|nr:hypothetical protein BV497_15195 [Fulvimonas soli]
MKHHVESIQQARRHHLALRPGRQGDPRRRENRPGRAPAGAEATEGGGPDESAARTPRSNAARQPVPVRYSPEVLTYFKSTGEGWQARMDQVLRDYVQRHSRRALSQTARRSSASSPCASASASCAGSRQGSASASAYQRRMPGSSRRRAA